MWAGERRKQIPETTEKFKEERKIDHISFAHTFKYFHLLTSDVSKISLKFIIAY